MNLVPLAAKRMTPDEKKALKRKAREQEVAAGRAAVPLTASAGKHLFDALDEHLSENDCDHSLGITLSVLRDEGVENVDAVVTWLREHGGYCDCEVLANVEEHWDSLRDSRF